MNLTFQIAFNETTAFVDYWAGKYHYPDEHKYLNNIGKPLTKRSRLELFEWKNGYGEKIAKDKLFSIQSNYPLVFSGDVRQRYLNHREPGGAIWNIFYLHCIDNRTWPIFDQHTYRAMQFIRTGLIREVGATNKQKYAAYEKEYLPFLLATFSGLDPRQVDRALFTFGKFLKLAKRYTDL